jgi:hypothetical protein
MRLSRWLVKCDTLWAQVGGLLERSPSDAQTTEAHPTDHRGD